MRLMERGRLRRWGDSLEDFDPEFGEAVLAQLGSVFGEGHYFPLTVDGWEHIPPAPVLFVGNHSGGTTIPDVWGLLYAWYQHFGMERVIHPLGHEMIFSLASVGRTFARLGLLRARSENAVAAVRERGRDVLVLPGGDRDTWRPWQDRYRVSFHGRQGYARLAIQLGVPVVPVAHVGAHHTLLVLTDGAAVARMFRLPQLARAEVFPISLSFPWGLTVGPLPHVPLPVRLRYRFGPAILPPVIVGPDEEPPAEALEALDAAVRAALQRQIHDLRDAARADGTVRKLVERLRER